MKVSSIAVVFCLFLCSAISFSQTAATQQISTVSTLSSGINLRSIPNAPFSADIVKQSTQTLPDGTQVPVETNGKMFRDSAGRTRTETELKSIVGSSQSLHYVTIVDPVARLNVRLNPQTKTATLFPFPANSTQAAQAKLKNVMAARSAMASPKPALVAAKDLGASTLQGFAVTGTKRTVPAAANAPGSARARNIVVESWFSSELQIELQSKTEDPTQGVSTTKLVNIGTAEPLAAMFQVPSDYTSVDYASVDYTSQNNSLRK
ncbi:MAG TPA: hypothetical protein VGN44_04870 [Candidatus Angelobacter sp.]|jgi:hypothetical protein